jgi:hypothetical protein
MPGTRTGWRLAGLVAFPAVPAGYKRETVMAKTTIIGIFDTRDSAQSAIEDLLKTGFDRKDIGLLTRLSEEAENEATHIADIEDNATYTADKAMEGAGYGAAIGGLAGLLLGLTTLAIPGVGPLVVAGSLALGVTGAGLGALEGLFFGAVTHLGIAEHHLPYYAAAVRRGKTLVSVMTAEARAREAGEILRHHRANEVHARAVLGREHVAAGPVHDEESLNPQSGNGSLLT